ncbi:hypothetical protein CYMTET_25429 [Cymbomonas tetramitiformis]|uniref:Uncharacterized protein n=1 Tax=Cymbomonas tetramitiformis TaxID=36881 RepID=A0AAE0FUJ4_9CHLO|nr:hypothetical protein CYMTET_25429 [Cymbomonas tetramitiformis]
MIGGKIRLEAKFRICLNNMRPTSRKRTMAFGNLLLISLHVAEKTYQSVQWTHRTGTSTSTPSVPGFSSHCQRLLP